MEFRLDYASLARKLESQELESISGRASPQVYGQLLSIYLLFNDLTSAKFLWKRIPNDVKEANTELSTIWSVGKLMWERNYSEIYNVINSYPTWPNHLNNIMKRIVESTRQNAISLITKAYSTILLEDVSRMTGLTQEETLKLIASLNWLYEPETGYVMVIKSEDKKNNTVAPDGNELLEKLTDYILFLEGSATR